MNSLTALFSFLFILGSVILYPITPRYFPNTKKFWLTSGAILLHTGLYGLLWMNLPWMISISLFLFEGGLFILWDPFHIIPFDHQKLFKVIGSVLTASSIALSLSFFTMFPLWLWALPALLYLCPYLIPPLKKWSTPILMVSLVLIVSYLGVIGSRLYERFGVNEDSILVSEPIGTTAPSPVSPLPENTSPVPVTPPPERMGPISTAIREADSRIIELEAENKKLQEELNTLKAERDQIKAVLDQQQGQLRENSQKIEDVKKAVEP